MSEGDKIVLTDLEEDQTGIITEITGGKNATKRLADLGLVPGTEVQVVSKTMFSGPLQIRACGSKLVIGRGLASKIFVRIK